MKMALRSAILTLAMLAPVNWAAANPDVYEKVLPSTGLIIRTANGKQLIGTCWVVDHDKKLVITNNHVIADGTEINVYFPLFENGAVMPLRDAHLKPQHKIAGQVIHRDVSRDLALVRLESLPAGAKALPLASKSSRPGETLHSIGNSGYNNGLLWRYTRGEVRAILPYRITLPTGVINATVIETQGPINGGDSGGPLVNDRCEIVGVVSAFDTKDRLITWNIDVREVRTFMQQAERNENAAVTGR